MSHEEYLKMGLIISFFFNSSVFFIVKSKKKTLIRLILFQKLANKIFPQKGDTLLFGLSFDKPVKQ